MSLKVQDPEGGKVTQLSVERQDFADGCATKAKSKACMAVPRTRIYELGTDQLSTFCLQFEDRVPEHVCPIDQSAALAKEPYSSQRRKCLPARQAMSS